MWFLTQQLAEGTCPHDVELFRCGHVQTGKSVRGTTQVTCALLVGHSLCALYWSYIAVETLHHEHCSAKVCSRRCLPGPRSWDLRQLHQGHGCCLLQTDFTNANALVARTLVVKDKAQLEEHCKVEWPCVAEFEPSLGSNFVGLTHSRHAASDMKMLWSMQLLSVMMSLATAIQSPIQAGVDPYDVIHVHIEEPSRLSPLGQQREREAKRHALELAESEQQLEHTMDATLAAQKVGHVWQGGC
eukprot:6166626-Amphidinium_carterae.2